jgi:hypothetical protein
MNSNIGKEFKHGDMVEFHVFGQYYTGILKIFRDVVDGELTCLFKSNKFIPQWESMLSKYSLGEPIYEIYKGEDLNDFLNDTVKKGRLRRRVAATAMAENEVEVFGRSKGQKQPTRRIARALPEAVEATGEPFVNEDGIYSFGGRRRSRRKSHRKRKNKRTRRH